MATKPFNKYNTFVEAAMEKKHDLGADALVIALSNTAQSATFTTLANVTEIAYTNLPALAARTLTGVTSAQTSGLYKLIANDLSIAATGTAAAFQYIVLYNSTAAAGSQLIGWWDNGVAVSLTSGQNFTIDFDGSLGVLQLQ
jgi:3D (Asp-Asp-Asp) domain-containing protein